MAEAEARFNAAQEAEARVAQEALTKAAEVMASAVGVADVEAATQALEKAVEALAHSDEAAIEAILKAADEAEAQAKAKEKAAKAAQAAAVAAAAAILMETTGQPATTPDIVPAATNKSVSSSAEMLQVEIPHVALWKTMTEDEPKLSSESIVPLPLPLRPPSNLTVRGDSNPYTMPPPFDESPELHINPEQIIGTKPSRSWQSEWVAMNVEQALLDGEEAFATSARFKDAGEESVEVKLIEHNEEIQRKVAGGWSLQHAQAHTLISAHGVPALARALGDADSTYAASTHAICEALASRAVTMVEDGTNTIAPFAFINLNGRFGLSGEDKTWARHLRPDATIGSQFSSLCVVSATASSACFPDDGGFGVPLMRQDKIVIETQDSPVVCFVSRATTQHKNAERASHTNGLVATGHSLIHSSASTYELPPLSTVRLEDVVPPGAWSAYGQKINQTLYVVGASYPVELPENRATAVAQERVSKKSRSRAASNSQLGSRLQRIAIPFLVDLLKADAELAVLDRAMQGSIDEAIDECHHRFKTGALDRDEFIKELGNFCGMHRVVRVAEQGY